MEQGNYIPDDFSIEALQKGSEHAFEAVFKAYYQALCYFGEKIIGDAQLAEEVAESVLLKLWEKRRDFANTNAIKAFLYISAKNACLNQLDKETRRHKRENIVANTAKVTEETLIAGIYHAEALRNICEVIEKLPEKYAKVVRMAYLDGMKNEEIAKGLNLPQSTVRNQKARGLAALRKQFPDGAMRLILLLLSI